MEWYPNVNIVKINVQQLDLILHCDLLNIFNRGHQNVLINSTSFSIKA